MGRGMAEREINIWDMLWAVCLKWRSILASAMIVTLLAGGFSYYRSARQAQVPVIDVNIEDVAADLDYEEKKNVDVYLDFMQMYNEQRMYNENAPLMLLDANGFYEGKISFYIDNHFAVEYPVISKNNNIVAMVNAYKSSLNTEEFAQEVADMYGADVDKSYAIEMVDCNNKYGNSNFVTSNYGEGILTISVYAPDDVTCNKLKELVKDKIDASRTAVTKQFGNHDVTILQDNVNFTADSDLMEYQNKQLNNLQTCATHMNNISGKFTDAQKEYVKICMEELEGDTGVVENEEETEVAVKAAPSVSKKMLALGFVGGAFLMFAFWALAYMLSNKIRLEDDFERAFESKLLGNVPVSKKGKKKWFAFLDKFFERLRHFNQRYFHEEEALDMVAANVRIAMQNVECKKLMVTGAVCGQDEKKVTEALGKRLKKDGIDLIKVSPVLYNAESLEKLVEIGQVILIEKAEESLYPEVQREIEICAQQEVTLVGCVVVY